MKYTRMGPGLSETMAGLEPVTGDAIDVTTTIVLPPAERESIIAHSHGADHGFWAALWPDARERWVWLSWMKRVNPTGDWNLTATGTTPPLECADGTTRRWSYTDSTPSAVVEGVLLAAGHGARLEAWGR